MSGVVDDMELRRHHRRQALAHGKFRLGEILARVGRLDQFRFDEVEKYRIAHLLPRLARYDEAGADFLTPRLATAPGRLLSDLLSLGLTLLTAFDLALVEWFQRATITLNPLIASGAHLSQHLSEIGIGSQVAQLVGIVFQIV